MFLKQRITLVPVCGVWRNTGASSTMREQNAAEPAEQNAVLNLTTMEKNRMQTDLINVSLDLYNLIVE